MSVLLALLSCLIFCLFFCLFFCLLFCRSVLLFIVLPFCSTVYCSVFLFFFLLSCLSVLLFISLSFCSSVYCSVFLFFCLLHQSCVAKFVYWPVLNVTWLFYFVTPYVRHIVTPLHPNLLDMLLTYMSLLWFSVIICWPAAVLLAPPPPLSWYFISVTRTLFYHVPRLWPCYFSWTQSCNYSNLQSLSCRSVPYFTLSDDLHS